MKDGGLASEGTKS